MFRRKENKKWFGKILVVIVCLAVVGTARADWPEQVKLLASDGAAGDYFGGSVSISGDYAIIGASADDSSTGSAYIFKRSDVPDDPNWYEQAKLTASDGAGGDCALALPFLSAAIMPLWGRMPMVAPARHIYSIATKAGQTTGASKPS